MARVSIIGTGNMGSAIGAVVNRGGNTVELFGQGHAGRRLDRAVCGTEQGRGVSGSLARAAAVANDLVHG